ncbi:uncharacterized protein BO80DRAFT_205868 [Aspergillus ibericus CBS 121593]|uniref:Uncharacterized protein n=1 Tax=Aspergillus ibericus CBS 121593 TaxID=1448316 RepID=A0A395HCG4_9EURO|nr:hypothetical protein BO80DRAFT_205868 [Aspergillus ibericus CBS 121593]RAL04648.1 hypothetical protein BO80DRAFT_205868 [Aspergillus ibericus CBS 121593]
MPRGESRVQKASVVGRRAAKLRPAAIGFKQQPWRRELRRRRPSRPPFAMEVRRALASLSQTSLSQNGLVHRTKTGDCACSPATAVSAWLLPPIFVAQPLAWPGSHLATAHPRSSRSHLRHTSG